jgi:hypothetical protein
VALVEFAIIAPLLFALLLGMFTGGMALSRKNSMTNAVREGSRLGATLVESDTWATSVRDRVRNLSSGDLTDAQICVELAVKTTSSETTLRQWPSGGCPNTAENPLAPGEPAMPVGVQEGECVVKVWARRTSLMETVFFSRDIVLTTNSISKFERGGTDTCPEV